MSLFIKIRKTFDIWINKTFWGQHIDLLLTGKKDKRHDIIIKDFNTFKYGDTFYNKRAHFGLYCLQDFSAKEKIQSHAKNCLKLVLCKGL